MHAQKGAAQLFAFCESNWSEPSEKKSFKFSWKNGELLSTVVVINGDTLIFPTTTIFENFIFAHGER